MDKTLKVGRDDVSSVCRTNLFHFPPFPEGELGGNGAVKEQDKSCVSETSSQCFLPIVSFAERVKVILPSLEKSESEFFFAEKVKVVLAC